MTEFIIIALFLYWGWRVINFKKQYHRDLVLLALTEDTAKTSPTPNALIEYAGALMHCQRYSDALTIYEDLDKQGLSRVYTVIPYNIAFCKKPHPFCNGPKNFNGSYRHNFILKRLGARRNPAISNETLLKANAIIRQMSRH